MWLTASIVKAPAEVIKRIFDEADRRDPKHRRTWIALVDGANHQIDRNRFEAKKRGIKVTIVVDFMHVLDPREASCVDSQRPRIPNGWIVQLPSRASRRAPTECSTSSMHCSSHPKMQQSHRCAAWLICISSLGLSLRRANAQASERLTAPGSARALRP
jgi:hypothetical protein